MSELPERTIGAAHHGLLNIPPGSVWGASRSVAMTVVEAAMDESLGPDRLVVAGPFEREIIERTIREVAAWLREPGKAWGPYPAAANALDARFGPTFIERTTCEPGH